MEIKELKVIDASTVLAGPSVGMFFAELGAKVTKIEHPINGDVTRSWKLPSEDINSPVSAYFFSVNYKKEYLKLDYKNTEDYNQFIALIKEADILITNFKKGDAEKFKLTDDVLLQHNPRLIHGKISGFGQDSDRVAYDLIVQAEAGFMSMNGTKESGPVKMPVALIDVLTAHQLKEGILVALLKRQSTQKGSVVEVSLYDSAVCSLINQATNYLNAGYVAQRTGSLHPNIAPYGEIFETIDKEQLTFAIGSDQHFSKLCQFLALPTLSTDERFKDNQSRVKNREELLKILQEKISNIESTVVLNELHKQHVPVGKIKLIDEVFDNPASQKLILQEEIEGIPTKRIKSVAFNIK